MPYYVRLTIYHAKSQTYRDTYEIIETEPDGSVLSGQTRLGSDPRHCWTTSNQGPFARLIDAEDRVAGLHARRAKALRSR